MEFPSDLKYSKEHEWVRLEGDTAVIGISDHAQDELGDVVYVELPEVGRALKQDETFGVVESVKAVSDVYTPLSGEISEVNTKLADEPELINNAPYGDGWIIKVKAADLSEMDGLMDVAAYQEFIGS